jgi:ATP-dependent helicase/DNAse subunit B
MEIEEDSMVVLAKKMMENRKELRDKGRKRKKKKKKAVWSSWNSLIEGLTIFCFS